jgi:hypothetical protein
MSKQPRGAPPSTVESISDPLHDLAALPARVRAMRAKILEAVDSGDIENLRAPIEWNETPPIFGRAGDRNSARARSFAEAIESLKARSFDGKGRETLRLLAAIFEQPHAKVTRGPVVTYVWPAFAVKQAPDPSPELRLAMFRCARFANLALHNDIGLPIMERVGIGADGTWHYFYSG